MKINFKKETLFWFLSFLIFVPRICLYFSDQDLKRNINPISENWTLYDKDKNLLSENIKVPHDLRRTEYKNKMYWIYETNIPLSHLNKLSKPTLVFGRIGDSDILYVNDCFIGATGYDNGIIGWWWSHIGFYEIPKSCLNDDLNRINVHVAKLGGPSYGIYGGPIGIGEYSIIKTKVDINDFLRYFFLFIFGITLLVFIGSYYLFVYFQLTEKKYNGIFGVLCVSIGVFLLMTSVLPFHYLSNATLLVKVLFLSAVFTSGYFLYFFQNKFHTVGSKFQKLFFIGSLALVIFGLGQNSLDKAYSVYEVWHAIFLLFFIYFYIQLLIQWKGNSNPDYWRYVIAVSAVVVCTIHDITTTIFGISNPYMITYGFMFFSTVVSLSLAKEYADAFLFVEEQVSERTRELSVAIEQAKGAEKMKEKFFAQISHDLKTPIAIAIGAIEESISKYSDSVGKILEPANRHLIRLNQMVLSILDNVKAESGTLKLQWQKVKVAQYLIGILEPFQGVAKKAGVNLDFNFSGYEGLSIPMDPEKMERVIENLITNSIKYTKTTDKSEKVVEVSIKVDQSKVYIGIEDSGLGIPKGEREKIFDKFFQSSITDLKIHGGSGIGLSFVKDMIELHNGSVYADESKYGGAKFTIELPLAQDIDNLQSYHFASTNPKILAGSLNVDYPKTNPDQIDPYKISILYCEDNPEMAQIGYSTLKDQYNVFFAENGHEGLKILDTNKIDLILSDIQMPQMDGYDLLKEVRKQPKFEKIPLIFLSSLGAEDDIVKGLNMGANDYLNKPMRKEMLHTRIKAQLKNSELLRKVVSSEKMSSLGLLMAGLAHELKNPIHALTGNIGYIDTKMLPKLSDPNQKPEVLDKMLENLKLITDAAKNSLSSMQRIVSSVNEFSSENKNKQKLDLNQVIQNSITMLQYKIKEVSHCEVVFKPSEEHEIYSYSSIEQVFVNLIQNAIDAVEDKKNGVIEINIQSSSDHKMIKIKDNGSGIDPKIIDHIFDAFMTTKEVKKGTGLGLYITKQIVENQLGGTITVISELGKGTTFTVDIPSESPDLTLVAKPFHGVENLI